MRLKTYDDLHDYQRNAIIKGINIEYGYMFLDTGMGKTVISLAIHDQLKKRSRIRRSLVCAPKYVMNNVWEQEARDWDFSKNFKFTRIHGSTYKGSAEFSRRMAYLDEPDFHLINYEGLVWLATHHLRYGNELPWDAIFYDESTRMKKSSTKRFKAWKRLMGMFKYRFCLTGTPTPNGLEDIFGQAYCSDQGAALGKTITGFRHNYMKPLYTLHGRVTIFGERNGARKQVAEKLAPRTIRLKKTDYLDLPPLKFHNVELELPDDMMKVYKDLEKDFYIQFKDAEVEAFSQVGADMKLRQFLQGRVYDAEGVAHRLNTYKMDALKKLTLSGNSLVAYNFRFERDDIRSVLKNNPPFLDARTKDHEATKWITQWNNYQHKHFLVNPASAAFGLNLQAGGSNVVWYCLTWNAEHYSQLIDRLWRQGQRAESVDVYHIIVKGTIDEVVAKALQRKDEDQTAFMQDIVNYMNRRR